MSTQKSDPGIELYGAWDPGIPLGAYSIDVEQTVKGRETNAPDWTFKSSHEFTVGAPRYSLTSADVLATFPAPKSTAPASYLLPYVSLNDPYLPWQRLGNSPVEWNKVPTMAVLVLADDEAAGMTPSTGEARALLSSSPDGVLAPKIEPPPPAGNNCRVIDVLVEDLRDRLLPDPVHDLPLLTHVRREVRQNTKDVLQAHSAVIASRFPRAMPDPAARDKRGKDQPCRYIAHLVSLLGHESNLTDRNLDPQKKLRLVSLWSWSFLTPASAAETYDTAFRHMVDNQKNTHRLRYTPLRPGDQKQSDPQTSIPAPIKERMRAGYVPISHCLATGEQTASWYRGPFGPWPPNPAAIPRHQPFSCADEALIYSTAECAFDISLASAWNIGYQLILSRRDLFGQLLTLKHDAGKILSKTMQATKNAVPDSAAFDKAVENAFDIASPRQKFDDMMRGIRAKRRRPLADDLTNALSNVSAVEVSTRPPAAPHERLEEQARLVGGKETDEATQGRDVPPTYGERPLAEHAAALVSHPGVSSQLKAILRQRHLRVADTPTLAERAGEPGSDMPEFAPGDAKPRSSPLDMQELAPSDEGSNSFSTDGVETWLWNATDLLMMLPAWYLLPFADAVIPTDSVRFFSVDERWLSAFADGMLAVGSHTSVDRLLEHLVANVVFEPRESAPAPVCGLIIRSEIIRAWPAPPVAEPVVGEAPVTTTDPGVFTVNGAKLVARTQLGPDTALLLFDQRPNEIILREPGHVMEFGLDSDDGKKSIKEADGSSTEVNVYRDFLRDSPGKSGKPWAGHLPESLDVQGLAKKIGCADAADFAFKMMNWPATLKITPPPLAEPRG